MPNLPRVSKKAYKLKASGPQIVLFHGYTGSPYDLKPLALFLHEHNYEVIVPLLKGHSTNVKALTTIKFSQWIKQAKDILKSLDPKRPIYLGGLSMGALLAIILAHNNSTIKKLILISPALELFFLGKLLIKSYKFNFFGKYFSWPKLNGQSDIADEQAKKICPSYEELPLFGLNEFNELRKMTLPLIKDLSCDIFAAFGTQDGTIDVHMSKKHLLNATNAKKIIIKDYSKSKHILPLDLQRVSLCNDVVNFLR